MKNLGILIFATGNYKYYLEVAIETLNKRFMNDMNKTFYVFTDYPNTSIKSFYNNVIIIPIAKTDRISFFFDIYQHIIDNRSLYAKEDYLHLFNVNLICQKNITLEDIPYLENKLIVSQHGYQLNNIPFKNTKEYYDSCEFEKNPDSTSYIPYIEGKNYGYFQKSGFAAPINEFLKLSMWCNEQIKIDKKNNIIPIWHDESIFNKYVFEFYQDTNKIHMLNGALYNLAGTLPGSESLRSNAKIFLFGKNYNIVRGENKNSDIAFDEQCVQRRITFTDSEGLTHRLRIRYKEVFDPISFQRGLLINETATTIKVLWTAGKHNKIQTILKND